MENYTRSRENYAMVTPHPRGPHKQKAPLLQYDVAKSPLPKGYP
jgi:hypothetical protein